jgi:hypothetical protein
MGPRRPLLPMAVAALMSVGRRNLARLRRGGGAAAAAKL